MAGPEVGDDDEGHGGGRLGHGAEEGLQRLDAAGGRADDDELGWRFRGSHQTPCSFLP